MKLFKEITADKASQVPNFAGAVTAAGCRDAQHPGYNQGRMAALSGNAAPRLFVKRVAA
jgi:hypothetical protein